MPLNYGGSSGYFEKVDSYEKLANLIKQYKGVLSPAMIEYLDSLINLEVSVLSEYANENDRILLSELYLYERIAVYNIYHRALNLFKKFDNKIIVESNADCLAGINVFSNNGEKKYIFEYDYVGNDVRKVPPCGKVTIYRYMSGPEQKELEIKRYKRKIKFADVGTLRPEKDIDGVAILGANSFKVMNARCEVENAIEGIKKLESSVNLTSNDIELIDTSNELCNLLLEDFGLKPEDFQSVDTISKTHVVEIERAEKLKVRVDKRTRYI